MAKFHITNEARNDLDGVWLYIARDNPDTADRVENEIIESLYLLADQPLIGHKREDLTSREVRFWSVYSYMIVYDANTKPISIVRVLSGFQDITSLL